MEDGLYKEMRAREAIKRNVIIHGVEEPDSRCKTDEERTEANLAVCDKIFRATGGKTGRRDIRFCQRIGERGQGKRPILLAMKSESIKAELLDAAPRLQNTECKNVSICPDQTRKQQRPETNLKEQMEQKNRKELTEDDRAKNLQWMAIGRKGEKRVVKAQIREDTQQRETGWRRENNRGDRRNNRYHTGGSNEARQSQDRNSKRMEQDNKDRN
jgi:hypothetical protein